MKTFILFLLTALSLSAQTFSRTLPFLGNATHGGAVASAPAPDLFYYKHTEGSGTTAASTGTGPTLNLINPTWSSSTPSGSGYCIDYNGTTAYGSTATTVTYDTNKFTFSFWLWLDTTASTMVIAESGNNYNNFDPAYLIYQDAGTTYFSIHSGTGYRTVSFASLSTGAWHHYLAVFDNTSAPGVITVWCDGAPKSLTSGDNNNTGTANFSAQTLFFGMRGLTANFYLDGRLDDVRAWKGDQSSWVSTIYADPQ